MRLTTIGKHLKLHSEWDAGLRGLSSMPNYFKPLRRKVGIATLAMALVAMGGWVRSLFVQDRVEFSRIAGFAIPQSSLAGFETTRHSLIFFEYTIEKYVVESGPGSKITPVADLIAHSPPVIGPAESKPTRPGAGMLSNNAPLTNSTIANTPTIVSIESLPTQLGTGVVTTLRQLPVFVIPYWTVVSPLTLFSAYLLFSKLPLKLQSSRLEPSAEPAA